MYIPEAMENNNFDDVEDIISQDNTSFPEDFSDRSLPLVMASLVAEKTSVEVSINLSLFSMLLYLQMSRW